MEFILQGENNMEFVMCWAMCLGYQAEVENPDYDAEDEESTPMMANPLSRENFIIQKIYEDAQAKVRTRKEAEGMVSVREEVDTFMSGVELVVTDPVMLKM